jgi:glycosyltransferase involved in cell wall biosynthesis
MMLTVLHSEASLGWGGQEVRVMAELMGFARRGHRTGLLAAPGAEILTRARAEGVPTWEVSFRHTLDLASALRVARVLRGQEADVLVTHSSKDAWVGGGAGILAGVPVVRVRHLAVPVRSNAISRLVYTRLCGRIVTTGEGGRDLLIRQARVPPERVVAVPTGVDLARFDPHRVDGAPVRRALGIPSDAPVVGMVAVLRSKKGHRYFVDAAREVVRAKPAARFLIVGEGPMRAAVEAWIAEAGLTGCVFLLGHREDIPEVMAAMDVVVLPSRRDEGVPQVLGQALAMERAVVTTDVAGVTELVVDGVTGLVVPPEDSQALADAVINLLQDRERARAIGREGARRVAEGFSLETMLDRMEAIYGEVAAARAAAGVQARPEQTRRAESP